MRSSESDVSSRIFPVLGQIGSVFMDVADVARLWIYEGFFFPKELMPNSTSHFSYISYILYIYIILHLYHLHQLHHITNIIYISYIPNYVRCISFIIYINFIYISKASLSTYSVRNRGNKYIIYKFNQLHLHHIQFLHGSCSRKSLHRS